MTPANRDILHDQLDANNFTATAARPRRADVADYSSITTNSATRRLDRDVVRETFLEGLLGVFVVRVDFESTVSGVNREVKVRGKA